MTDKTAIATAEVIDLTDQRGRHDW